MAAMFDTGPAAPEITAGESSSNGAGLQGRPSSTAAGGGDGKPAEKTISCMSCRRRKLKCDRVKPCCGSCARLRHDCEYPERKKNLGAKKRNIKELEARLAQVETQLVAEGKATKTTSQTASRVNTESEWSTLGLDMNLGLAPEDMLESFDVMQSDLDFSMAELVPVFPGGNTFSQELIGLGLSEPLPPQDMIDELHDIYFAGFHLQMPIIHKYRYFASLDRAPQARPPVCLRYAIWLIAAAASGKYALYEPIFYERTRRYIQLDEMKGHGEAFVSLQHAQTWALISHYEANNTLFSRSWMSTGRLIRLSQMLGLYRLDNDDADSKNILPQPRDWIELEERRRVFWGAFYCDRWACSGTGWPMLIQEDEVTTHLPASEEAFENGILETSFSLDEALTLNNASRVSTFGGMILSAALYGRNFYHLAKSGPKSHPEDVANGEFWKRHREMDNVLSSTFMFLPERLKMPTGIRNMSIIFMHMNIHCSVICLHRAAVMTGTRYKIESSIIQHSQNRSFMAATEIANIMRLVCHADLSNMNTAVAFCLYVAAGVFLKDAQSATPNPQSLANLEFILSALRALSKYQSIINHFTAQLELDVEAIGVRHKGTTRKDVVSEFQGNGLIPERYRDPLRVEELKEITAAFERRTGCYALSQTDDPSDYMQSYQDFAKNKTAAVRRSNDSTNGQKTDPTNFDMNSFVGIITQSPVDESTSSPATSNTSNPMNFPYRQATPSSLYANGHNVAMPATMDDVGMLPEWTMPAQPPTDDKDPRDGKFSVLDNIYSPKISGLMSADIWGTGRGA